MFPWQIACIDAAKNDNSIVYSEPTSGGKTLVAELLMFAELQRRPGFAMFIMPYVSLVAEKERSLVTLMKAFPGSPGVQSIHSHKRSRLKEDTALVVCTIEKANQLWNWLLNDGAEALPKLSCVVVDEIHTLSD